MAARKIDNNRFKQCVIDAEANGGLSTLGDLYDKVAELYNVAVPSGMKAITKNHAKSNIAEMALTVKTVNGRAKAAAVDMAQLKKSVVDAEKGGPLENRSALFTVVATSYNAATGQNCSGATLQQLVNKQGWELITPKGKPGGRKPGQVITRRPRSEKLAADPVYADSIKAMRRTVPLDMLPRLEKTLERAEKGSLTARIKLKCLDCCNMQPIEVKLCSIMDCSLWPIRPYRGRSDGSAVVDEDADTDGDDIEQQEDEGDE